MKHVFKFFLIINCFAFTCTSQTQSSNFVSGIDEGTGNPVSSVNDINSLIKYNGSADVLNVEDKERGGHFKLTNDVSLVNDYGIVFPASNRQDMHWVRQTGKDEPANLKWFGAKGDGVAHYKEDSTALMNAVKSIAKKGGGKLYIPAATSFYAYNGIGILLPDNIEVYGDGDKSEIKNINPDFGGSFYRGVIFYTTTYGPNNFNGITRVPTYTINNGKRGQNFVVVNKSSRRWSPGDLIGLGANYFYKKELAYKARYSEFELNEITKVDGDTIYLKYPLSSNLRYVQPEAPKQNDDEPNLTKNGRPKKQRNVRNTERKAEKNQELAEQNDNNSGYPVIVDINANKTYNDVFQTYDRITRNIYIHHLKLSQSDYNMITNQPYKAQKPPSNVISLGGTFESKFDHLTLEGAGTFGGNLWNRCEISNITIYSQRKLFDLGYGSANTKLHDIKWIYKHTKIEEDNIALVYLNDGTHDIELSNINVSGAWSRGNVFQLAGGSHDINVHDVIIDLPEYNSPNGRIISIRDDNENVYVYNASFRNLTVKLKQVGYFIWVDGVDIPDVQKNIKFDHVNFIGAPSQTAKSGVLANNCSNVQFSNVNVPGGDIYMANVSNGEIDNVKAPNSYFIFSSKGSKPHPKVSNSVYKGVKAE